MASEDPVQEGKAEVVGRLAEAPRRGVSWAEQTRLYDNRRRKALLAPKSQIFWLPVTKRAGFAVK